MPEASPIVPPRAILLATDLSARCDRALDRAVALARQWQARLVVLTVLDPSVRLLAEAAAGHVPERPDPLEAALRRLRADADADDVDLVLRVEEGHPGEALLATALEFDCGLIVTGVARNETLGRRLLGTTVDWLVRRATLPVLVVQNRPRRPYATMVAANDFSTSSRYALRVGAAFFPEGRLTLFHAVDVPLLGLRDRSREEAVAEARSAAMLEAREVLEEAGLPAPLRQAADIVVEHGDPARLLRDHVRERAPDLLLLATHGRGALFDIVLGSMARRILECAGTDVLLVRDPRASRAGRREEG
ncbi:universal stress protein [Coralloluteibacterium thermophilus]|uniref:Universal stress protein n=1 Tax=Coralloluteibacterium thermophilum TaxID=2707049 RepID=A0ABV9NHJ3_9GAMM